MKFQRQQKIVRLFPDEFYKEWPVPNNILHGYIWKRKPDKMKKPSKEY